MGKNAFIHVRLLFISTFSCVFPGNVRFYGLQDPLLDLNKNTYACKRGELYRSKRVSCNLQNLTSPRKTHESVLIKSDLPLMCRGIFPYYHVLFFGGGGEGGKNKTVREYRPQNRQYLHSQSEVVTDGIRVMPKRKPIPQLVYLLSLLILISLWKGTTSSKVNFLAILIYSPTIPVHHSQELTGS